MKPLALLLLILTGCDHTAADQLVVTPPCGNQTCGVADCRCVECSCDHFGACYKEPSPVPVVEVSQPRMPQVMEQILDTSKRPTVCGPNGCGPAAGSGRAYVSQRRAPVRGFVRRLFGR